MLYPPPTSSHKDEVGDDARRSDSPTPLPLNVPSPEHAWTGVELARALGGRPAGVSASAAPPAPSDAVRDRGDEAGGERAAASEAAATSAIFSFPFKPAAGTPLPSLTTILPTRRTLLSEESTGTDCGARGPKQKRCDNPTDTADTASLRLISTTSFPSVSGSGAATSAAAHRHACPGPPAVPPLATSTRSRSKCDFADSTLLALRPESTVPSSFTDLFVGLERPRLHCRRQQERLQRRAHAVNDVDVDAQASLLSLPSSTSLSMHRTTSPGPHVGTFSDEDDTSDGSDAHTTEDEDGANTPTVYRSPQLPHWWRSIVTPVPGARVSLRPDTCHLEFWWIDRLGYEAYEIIRIILKHSLEGVVLRHSGEAAVVVEFRILPHHLKSTSYAVARRSRKRRDASPMPAANVNMSESFSMPFVDSVRSPTSTSSSSSVPFEKPTAVTPSPSPDMYLQLPALVRTGSTSKVECSRRQPGEPVAGGQLTSPSRFPVPPRRPTAGLISAGAGEKTPSTKASMSTPYARASLSHPRQTQKLEAARGASFALSPSPHPCLSCAVGSTAVAVAGLSAGPSVERTLHCPPLFHVLDTTAAQQKQSSLPPVPQTSPRNGAAAAAVAMVAPAEHIGGNGEEEVDAAAVNGSGGDKSVRSVASANVTTNPNGSASSVLPAALPLMRRLIQGKRPATKLDEARGTSIIGGADPAVASVVPTPSLSAHRSPYSMSHRRSSPQPQCSCDRLPLTIKVSTMPLNSAGPGNSHNRTNNNDSDGEAHLPSIPEGGPFLAHVEPHHNTKANAHQQRSGGAVVGSPTTSAPNPLLSASDHCDPALPGNSSSDWQHGGRRSHEPQLRSSERQLLPQQPHHQHPQGSLVSVATSYADATAMAVAAATEAARLVVATDRYTTSAAASSQQETAPLGHTQSVVAEDNDSVVANLTLPVSMCTPVVVVRLHAMRILHPLLHAITVSHGPAFSASTSGDYRNSDNTDTDSADEGPVTAAQLPDAAPPPSSTRHAKGPDYAGAIRIFSEVIESLEREKSAEETPPTATAPTGRALMRARDLSILYTVRSHLFFHASPMSLYDSLRDAEAALRCHPARDHINPTYEVLVANLISLGCISQVEDLSRHLRHRWRVASPLLLRLGRVTQVMVSYASIFLRQLIPTSTLRLCVGGSASTMQQSSTSDIVMGSASLTSMLPSPNSAREVGVPRCFSRDSPTPSGTPNPALMPQTIAVVCDDDAQVSTDRPRPPSPHPASKRREHISPHLFRHGDGRGTRRAPIARTATDTPLLPTHTLPYEVCPLLLSRYGRNLHAAGAENTNADPVQHNPSPARPSPRSLLQGSHQPSCPLRPGTDVCRRRVFLLETLFPSMNPTPVNRLPLSLPHGYRGARGQRSQLPASQPSSAKATNGRGNNSAALSSVINVPRTESKRRVRAEDFMYDRDSMLALLAGTADTTMRWGTVPMQYFCRHIRLSATHRIRTGETILMERPALLIPFWPLLPPRSATTSTGTTAPRRGNGTGIGVNDTCRSTAAAPSCCAQCGRQRLSKPVNCPGGCHSVYCSEQCRQLALRLYHVVECGGIPPDSDNARALEPGDDVRARVRRTVAVLQEIFSEWNIYLHHLARGDTSSIRLTTPLAASSPVPPPGVRPVSPSPVGDMPEHDASQQQQSGASNSKASGPGKRCFESPPILAVTAMRVMARLGAMLLSLTLPVELLPQMQGHSSWAAERHAMIRAVARTLHQRGLMVAATATSAAAGGNAYCTHVDPHRLLLLEVLLQQLSVPFFADFNYRASSTVWEGLHQFPFEVKRSSDNPIAPTDHEKAADSSVNGWRPGMFRSPPIPTNVQQQQQHNSFVELTPAQLEEAIRDLHSMVHRVYQVLVKELVGVPSLALCGAEAEENNSLEWGLPGRWNCVELLGFLNSTRAFQQISDFSLTSWAVVYPRDMEPPNIAASMATESRNMSQSRSFVVGDERPMNINRYGSSSSTVTDECNHAGPSDTSGPVAVPLAVISPWSCLTVDLHPILGDTLGGVIYSRFMVEHEQRRRMLAYCAAAAGRRGGDGTGGGSGNEDSFLSVHSAASTSAAALLAGDDSSRTGSLLDDISLQLIEEAARRSCSNLHISLVYTPTKEPVVLVVAKKNITPGDVLWWESMNCRDYLSELL
ncbi:hypothetical protein CUR178_07922 [Leishmania enriettii]|uniref:MYND-type domain-containing protein n=1 Tax=Leishmania enriettii TaxID=5663 RepID=A0A836HLX9_LEIEN|nr:hypothetical protein CUR178_07922 [Leishmania enriettii]